MIKVFCDRCETEISSSNRARIISVSDANVLFEKDDFSEVDGIYCEPCTELVREILHVESETTDGKGPTTDA